MDRIVRIGGNLGCRLRSNLSGQFRPPKSREHAGSSQSSDAQRCQAYLDTRAPERGGRFARGEARGIASELRRPQSIQAFDGLRRKHAEPRST